jgi:uncharacterized protein YkwD
LRDPRHYLRYVLLSALAAAILLPAPAAAENRSVVGTHKLRTAETRMLKDINRIRVRNGRRPLRIDRRTSQVARARSADMAAKRYFAHVEPDGDDARRILYRRDIRASSVTENIGQTYGLTLREGSNRMPKWWYRSPPHRRQMLARDSNYVGVGVARRGSRLTYTAIFTRSRDKTDPRLTIAETTVSHDGTQVTIDWHGVDPKLAIGTAGIGRYDLEHFSPLDGWRPVGGDTRGSQRSFWTLGANDRHVRIRAVDRAGNVSPWAYTRIEAPDRTPRLL